MALRNRKRGNTKSGLDGLSRVERRGKAGFVVYCKCDRFTSHSPELLQQQPWRHGTCRVCGARRCEWRCPVHKLLADPLEPEAETKTAGCPRCGRAPKEQKHDAYMTSRAKHG